MRKYRLLRTIFNFRWSLNKLSLSLECHNARLLCLRWRSDLGSQRFFKVGGQFEAGMLTIIDYAKISTAAHYFQFPLVASLFVAISGVSQCKGTMYAMS